VRREKQGMEHDCLDIGTFILHMEAVRNWRVSCAQKCRFRRGVGNLINQPFNVLGSQWILSQQTGIKERG
jgi:hypothetical protein